MKIFAFALFAASVLASCTIDSLDEEKSSKETDIQFSLTNDNGNGLSRATTTTQQMITQYGVSCSYYPSILSYSSAACGSYFFNVKVDASDGRPGYFWPGKKYRLSFFAYFPCDNANINLVSDLGQNGMPEYEYNIPSDVAQQVDFLTCNIVDHEGSAMEPVPLVFNHKCAEIKFSTHNKTDDVITLKSICVKGMKYRGRLVNDSFILSGDTNTDILNPFVFHSNAVIGADFTLDATGTDKHFIVLPQTVTTGTEIFSVKTLENNEEVTYSYTLPSDQSFHEGKSYSFRLSLGHGEMTVEQVSIQPWLDDDAKNGEMAIPADSKAVDLGLPSGTKWAAGNLGAVKETDPGLFYSWADVEGYTKGSDNFNETVYNNKGLNLLMEDIEMHMEYDAVHNALGGSWRMPTNKDFNELKRYCSFDYITDYKESGVDGFIVSSNQNGNEIFLPAAYGKEQAYYWTSWLDDSKPNKSASSFYILSNIETVIPCYRYVGLSLRGVCLE